MKPDPKTMRVYGQLTAVGFSKAILLALAVWLGSILDARFNTKPWITVGLVAVAFSLGLWLLLRTLSSLK